MGALRLIAIVGLATAMWLLPLASTYAAMPEKVTFQGQAVMA